MSDLHDLASATGDESAPGGPGGNSGARAGPGKKAKPPARRRTGDDPLRPEGPSGSTILALGIVGVILIGVGVWLAVRSGKHSAVEPPLAPQAAAPVTQPASPQAAKPAAPAAEAAPAPDSVAAALESALKSPPKPKPARRPAAPPPPEPFATAAEALEISVKAIEGDLVDAKVVNKSSRGLKHVRIALYARGDESIQLGDITITYLAPRGTMAGEVPINGLSRNVEPGDVPRVEVEAGEFLKPGEKLPKEPEETGL